MAVSRRNLYYLLASLSLILMSLACNIGATAPLPPTDGAGAAPQTTQVVEVPSYTQQAIISQPTATISSALILPSVFATPTPEFLPAPPPSEPVVSPAIPESRRLTLEYPPTIRLGDTDVIRLTLEVDNLGNIIPTAIIQGNTVNGTTVQVPNLYNTHKVTAEARLDLAGPIITPPDTISEPLLPGDSVTFYWSVRPQEAGSYRGTVWLTVKFVNKADVSDVTEKTVSAQQVQIEATTFLGLKANTARAAGGVGSFIGGVLGFPFIDDILKWLWRRLGLGR